MINYGSKLQFIKGLITNAGKISSRGKYTFVGGKKLLTSKLDKTEQEDLFMLATAMRQTSPVWSVINTMVNPDTGITSFFIDSCMSPNMLLGMWQSYNEQNMDEVYINDNVLKLVRLTSYDPEAVIIQVDCESSVSHEGLDYITHVLNECIREYMSVTCKEVREEDLVNMVEYLNEFTSSNETIKPVVEKLSIKYHIPEAVTIMDKNIETANILVEMLKGAYSDEQEVQVDNPLVQELIQNQII